MWTVGAGRTAFKNDNRHRSWWWIGRPLKCIIDVVLFILSFADISLKRGVWIGRSGTYLFGAQANDGDRTSSLVEAPLRARMVCCPAFWYFEIWIGSGCRTLRAMLRAPRCAPPRSTADSMSCYSRAEWVGKRAGLTGTSQSSQQTRRRKAEKVYKSSRQPTIKKNRKPRYCTQHLLSM